MRVRSTACAPGAWGTCTLTCCVDNDENVACFWPPRSEHVATSCNNVARCCVEMLRAFGQTLREVTYASAVCSGKKTRWRMGQATFPKWRTKKKFSSYDYFFSFIKEDDGDKKENEKTDWRGPVGYFVRDIFRKRKEQGDSKLQPASGPRILLLAICWKGRDTCEPLQEVSNSCKKIVPSDAVLGIIEVLHGSHVALREQWKCIALERTFVPIGKRIYCSCHATWLPCKTSIGSLSTRVFETRTATGREHFACQDSGISQIFILIISNGEKIVSNVNVVVWIQIKRENGSLPVVVRVSKTRVLKLPTYPLA